MANDLDLRNNGDLAPVPGNTGLAPTAGDRMPAIDHLGQNYIAGRNVSPAPQQRQQVGTPASSWFGSPVPQGISVQQLELAIDQLGAVFSMDMLQLGHPKKHIDSALAWCYANFDNPRLDEPKRHNYPIPAGFEDGLSTSFLNHCHRAGCSPQLVQSALWWITEASKKLNQGTAVSSANQGRSNSFGSPDLDNYTPSQQDAIIKANEQAAMRTEVHLKQKYGASYASVVQMANAQLAKLPPKEQRHLAGLTQGGVSGLNTVEIVEGLYLQAIGSGSLPKGSHNIAAEIKQIESIMGTKAYLKDEALQARYRHLIDAQLKGK